MVVVGGRRVVEERRGDVRVGNPVCLGSVDRASNPRLESFLMGRSFCGDEFDGVTIIEMWVCH